VALGVEAAQACNSAKGILRGQAEQLDRRLGGVVRIDTERVGHLLLDSVEGGIDVELDLAAEEVVRVEIAEDDVAIGDRQNLVATLEADGSRRGSGAVGADLHLLRDRVEPDVAPGAGADRLHVERRQVQHEPGDHRLGLDRNVTLRDGGDVEARAAEVGHDHVWLVQDARDVSAGHAPPDRTRDERLVQTRVADVAEAAVGQHRLQVVLELLPLERVLDLEQVRPRRRSGVRLEENAVQP
jgi:hypothetical protein